MIAADAKLARNKRQLLGYRPLSGQILISRTITVQTATLGRAPCGGFHMPSIVARKLPFDIN